MNNFLERNAKTDKQMQSIKNSMTTIV